MIQRVISTGLALALIACVSARTWDPSTAVADADRDIAAGRIRFAYIGGYVSHAPGLPEGPATLKTLERYRHLDVGPQGCILDEHSAARAQYARRYNQVMWRYVSKQR